MTQICIELTDGRKMTLELYPEHAPLSVENFLNLIEEKFFDGLCFHRVIPGFMVQGGGFKHENNRLLQKNAKKSVKGEFKSNGVNNTLKHTPGVISMARTMVPDSATSQFFICVADTPYLDGQYAAFGKTVDDESLKVAIDISTVKTTSIGYYQDVPVDPIVIKTITKLG